MKNKKIIIILGMHRSGTSLVASWLQSCGLHIGDALLSGGIGNPKGHFEDLDFLNFHEGILKKCGYNYKNALPEKLNVNEIDFYLANSLLEIKTKNKDIIAWKEPRTCIFINNLWLKTKLNKKIIFVYRPFEQIIRSLYQRHIDSLYPEYGRYLFSHKLLRKIKKQLFIRKYKKQIIEEYCTMYINYMQEVIKAFNQIKDKRDFLSIDITKIEHQQNSILDYIINEWSLSISKKKLENIYRKNMIKKDIIDLSYISYNLLNKCKIIDEKLQSLFISQI